VEGCKCILFQKGWSCYFFPSCAFVRPSHSGKWQSASGWPDWANFRLLGGCLLWATFYLCKNALKVLIPTLGWAAFRQLRSCTYIQVCTYIQYRDYFCPLLRYICIDFDKNCLGYILGHFFPKQNKHNTSELFIRKPR
jgi:hypothetical protein